MSRFGELIRFYREKCIDPGLGRKLTQEKLGELIGEELGGAGYTGAAVSDWERGKSQIDKDHRATLTSLIRVLYICGGLKTPAEANALLHAGNYRSLDEIEQSQIFPTNDKGSNPHSIAKDFLMFTSFIRMSCDKFVDEIQATISDSSKGASPHWPHALLDILGWPVKHWSSDKMLHVVFWVTTWLLTWKLTIPLMYWPFTNQEKVGETVVFYVAGSLVIPLFIGGLTRTRDDRFWQQQRLASSVLLRLYTHQGAMWGFHLGYSTIFLLSLLGYYLGFLVSSSSWVGAFIAIWPVLFGYVAAKQVPFNLWRAYGELRLSDGAIFFVAVLFGPAWGIFYYFFYPLLLSPIIGSVTFLLAVGTLSALMVWQNHKTGSSLIPSYVWTAIFGSILALFQFAMTSSIFHSIALLCLVIIITALLARGRIHMSLLGGCVFLLAASLNLLCFELNLWAGRILALTFGIIWWRWGKKYIWFPVSFWGIIIIVVFVKLLIRFEILTEMLGAILLLIATLIITRLNSSQKHLE